MVDINKIIRKIPDPVNKILGGQIINQKVRQSNNGNNYPNYKYKAEFKIGRDEWVKLKTYKNFNDSEYAESEKINEFTINGIKVHDYHESIIAYGNDLEKIKQAVIEVYVRTMKETGERKSFNEAVKKLKSIGITWSKSYEQTKDI